MLDLAITGGEVIDGTGTSRYRADVGISDGRIVTVGVLDEPAGRHISAEGQIVSPGFIDVHTHYDAQVMWDPHVTPSPLHGVTTVLGGNCGFTLAPMRSEAADYLTSMLGRVEGMPLGSVRAGIDVTWQSFEEYLERLDGNVAVNTGFLVGHSTIRRIVLGEDWRREATPDEVAQMRLLLAESLAGGALGLSSSWSDTHSDAAGDAVPSRFATEEELLQLCEIVSEYPGTWLEFIPVATGAFPEDRSLLMARMSATARRPLNWNLLIVRPDLDDTYIGSRLGASDLAASQGGTVFGLTLPIPQTLHINLDSGFLFDSSPVWADVLSQPRSEKLRMLEEPGVRQVLATAARGANRIWYDVERLTFERVVTKKHASLVGTTVANSARARGVDPFELLFDVAIDDELSTVLMIPPQGDDEASWRRRAKLWRDPRLLVGGSDAGAHYDMLDTFGYFTDLLGPSVRDRQLLSLEDAVRYVTGDAARAFGLRDRGRIAEGLMADIVVFDEHQIATAPTEVRNDLPAGGMRLYAEARGVSKVLVNGVLVVDKGELTPQHPGTVLRSGRDTETVSI